MNNRFDSIIKQRNRERLEKTREYYSRPEHQNELSPANWKAFSEALADTEHDLIVYAPQYHILLPEYKKAIQEPIFQGIDLDDLFYFFDPDYVLDNMDHLPMLNSTQKSYDPAELVKPFLLPLFFRYKVLTAAGMTTATDFQTELLDQQIEEELTRKQYNGKSLAELINEVSLSDSDIEDTALYKAISKAFTTLTEVNFPKLPAIGSPKRYYAPNTYLSNAMMGYTEKGEFVGIGGRNFQTLKNTKTYFCVDWSGPTIETYGKPWLEFDRSINNAVCSLFLWACEMNLPPIFTADVIYRAANGKDSTYTVTDSNRAETIKSLEKQNNFIHITIDATDEMKARRATYKGKAIEEFKIEDSALHYRIVYIKAGGHKVKAYDFTGNEPIMLTYAMLNKELITIHPDLLDVKSVSDAGKIEYSLSLDRDRMAIRDYLMRRWKTIVKAHDSAVEEYGKYQKRCQLNKKPVEYDLEHFCNNKKLKPVILFDTMFESLQITNKNKKTDARNYALDVFKYWKAKEEEKGRTLNYEPRKKGKSYDAIEIKFD